jgi:hypothetical protein
MKKIIHFVFQQYLHGVPHPVAIIAMRILKFSSPLSGKKYQQIRLATWIPDLGF